ncbi:MAG TPA: FAD-dependent oxidoreductase [Candidatus Binataceae bacterium]|nr:FAD-dependent oxidoreductase [Candidatus Binataceae bacterium]
MERPVYRARVERILEHCSDTRSLFLRTLSEPLPSYTPGMFVSVTIPLANEVRTRPYTIASSPEDGEPFELVFNIVPNGPGAAWMFYRKVGDILDFTGPFGAFTLGRAPDQPTVFIAEGTAIAPIRPMLRRVLSQAPAGRIDLLYAAPDQDHLLYRTELESLANANAGFGFEPLIIEQKLLEERMLAFVQSRWIVADENRSRHFYICGIGQAVLKLRDLLRAAGYERRAVHYEKW